MFLGVTLAGFGGSSAVASTSLQRALADSHYALPAGYTSARSVVINVSGSTQGAVGDVTFMLQGPKQHGQLYNGIVYYSIYRSDADAQAAIAKPVSGPPDALHVIAHSVPGFSSFPGARFSGTALAKNNAGDTTVAISEASIADGDVAVTVLTTKAPQDETPVLRSAVAHLQAAEETAAR